MADLNDNHPFEDFPRGNLTNGITRRQLLPTLATELHLFSEKKEGLVGIKLSNLGALPDEDLKDFIPAIVPGTEIQVENDTVYASLNGGKKVVRLFRIDPISTFTFNLINGENTVDCIANQLAQRYAMPYERAFAITRGMFLTFVKLNVCLPANNPFAG